MNRSQPMVSVIIPLFNCRAFIAPCIESVLKQDFPHYEVIVVDDGSSDGSSDIARQFEPAIKYVYQSNKGTSYARNLGIELAQGEYTAFLDHDDLWMPEKLSFQVDAMENNRALDAVFTLVQQFMDVSLSQEERKQIVLNQDPMPGMIPSTALIRREFFESIGFFTPGVYLEWAEWYMRAVQAGIKQMVVEKVLAKRRVHRNNKGRALPDCRKKYVRLVKAALDRNRQKNRLSVSNGHQPDILRLDQ